jgi:hypothetical protein
MRLRTDAFQRRRRKLRKGQVGCSSRDSAQAGKRFRCRERKIARCRQNDCQLQLVEDETRRQKKVRGENRKQKTVEDGSRKQKPVALERLKLNLRWCSLAG